MKMNSKSLGTMAQTGTSNPMKRSTTNQMMAQMRRLIPAVVALAMLIGALAAAPAAQAGNVAGRKTPKLVASTGSLKPADTLAQADSCTYSGDRLWALCPAVANSTYYLYQAYNRQWHKVATAWFRSGFTYLSASGLTIAQNNSNGQTWLYSPTSSGWINITGLNGQAVNNVLVTNQINYNQARLVQVLGGLTTMPSLWP